MMLWHMVETITFVSIYAGELNHSMASERWCEMKFETIHSREPFAIGFHLVDPFVT